jgi:hypothetical protein
MTRAIYGANCNRTTLKNGRGWLNIVVLPGGKLTIDAIEPKTNTATIALWFDDPEELRHIADAIYAELLKTSPDKCAEALRRFEEAVGRYLEATDGTHSRT